MKNTKEKVMEMLIENAGDFVSGESISQNLGISRSSIWKHINTLKSEGFEIESKTGSGYRLKNFSRNLTLLYDIKKNLETGFIGHNIEFFKTISSTNTYAKKVASKSKEGTVIMSEEQTEGRGRFGRKWLSESGEGIYFSLILKPCIPISEISFITQVAAYSLVNTFSEFNIPCTVKWPNDILLNEKKICGILTEMSAEVNRIEYVVLGIGINICNTYFPDEIKNIATSLKLNGYIIDRANLIRRFFETFENAYIQFINGHRETIISSLKKHSAVIGKDIYIIDGKDHLSVKAVDINHNGNLVVIDENGCTHEIFSGEISIRGKNSYI